MATTNITLMQEYYDGCDIGDLDRVKDCVEKGVDIDGKDYTGSPLRTACVNNHHEIIEYLIGKGADVAIPGYIGRTALIFVSENGHTKIVELLLIQNSSTNFIRHQDYRGKTALMYAAQNEHEDIVRLLLFYDPSEEHILIEDKNGKTAIDLAKTEVTGKIRGLLRSPPKINTKKAKPLF